jgi:hypothetical protein
MMSVRQDIQPNKYQNTSAAQRRSGLPRELPGTGGIARALMSALRQQGSQM